MLDGCRVLDCSERPGWLAGRVLADLGAEVIKIEPPGAAIQDLDWQAYNVNKRLLTLDLSESGGLAAFDRLIRQADIVIACVKPGTQGAELFGYERFAQLNPSVIVLSIALFGKDGPRAEWRASDIELMAAGGAMSLAGEPRSAPLRISVPQAYCWTGVQAAVGALIALNHRSSTGRGQQVNVSAQASVLAALGNAPPFWDLNRIEPTRAGSYAPGRSVTGAHYRAFWPCKDGYLNFIIYGGSAGRRTNERLVQWIIESGADAGVLKEIDWATFDPTVADQHEVDAIEEPIAHFFEGLSKKKFLEETSAREMLGYPVFTVADIDSDPQLEFRRFWQDVPGPDGKKQRHCGCFFLVDGKRPTLRYPADQSGLEHPELLTEASFTQSEMKRPAAAPRETNSRSHARQVLEGVKVVEFGGYAAGPQIGKILANFGATVVHVESEDRPDGFRLEYPPFKGRKPGINRGGTFAFFNDSKYGVTLDVKKPGGVDLARRLVDWSDIVVENMRPGVIARMGLGYETFKDSNQGLIMLSTCNMGQTGPRANTPGFGSQLSALAGFSGVTGMADGPPMLLFGPYIDFIAANFGAAAVLAALESRRGTGKGVRIDLSQYEAGLFFMAGALLDYHVSGRVAGRDGNDDPIAAPHGAYPCRDSGWVALSCWNDSQFQAFAEVLDRKDLLDDPRFADSRARHANKGELDIIIAGWCETRDPNEVAETLQAENVNAYPVNTISDLFSDPQLRRLNIWRKRTHPVIGDHTYMFTPFDLADNPGDITGPAPVLGGDNHTVFRKFLGLSKEEYKAFELNRVIGPSSLAKERV